MMGRNFTQKTRLLKDIVEYFYVVIEFHCYKKSKKKRGRSIMVICLSKVNSISCRTIKFKINILDNKGNTKFPLFIF